MHKAVHMKNSCVWKAVFKQWYAICDEIIYLYSFLSCRITAQGHCIQDLGLLT